MKKLSLQWRITLMTVLLIGVTCVTMKLLLCCSGVHYMDSIGAIPARTTALPMETSRLSLIPRRQSTGAGCSPSSSTGRRRIFA